MHKHKSKDSIIIISNFPPKICGIAAFSLDLFNSLNKIYSKSINVKIIPILKQGEKKHRKKYIFDFLPKEDHNSYIEIAQKINQDNGIKIVNIQHEYGLFGGEFGSFLLTFLKHLEKPAVLTFHSVIPNPNQDFLKITKKLAKYAQQIIVMNNNSKHILSSHYGIDNNKISVIDHGVHSYPYEPNRKYKKKLRFKNKNILLTFGLLSINKGIEYVIEALPEVIRKYPDLIYIYLGQTHPEILKKEGELYRNFLIKKAKSLKIHNNILFINKFLKVNKVLEYIKCCDIYLATGIESTQAVSGTFSYAISSGRPVISTDFIQAKEYIKDNTGILVPPKDPKAYAHAISNLLYDKNKRISIGKTSYFLTRKMIWENVALTYIDIFKKVIMEKSKIYPTLPPITLKHLIKLTDDFGIIQFSKFSNPDITSGYTVDDNARSLIVSCLYYKINKKSKILNLIKTYLNFLEYSFDETKNYFINYIDYDKRYNINLNKKERPKDHNARAFYALARLISLNCIPKKFKIKANDIIEKFNKKKKNFPHLRSKAFLIKGYYYLKNKNFNHLILKYADNLIKNFNLNSKPDWLWFENHFSYANGVLPEALLLAYQKTGNKKYLEIGKKTAEFLIKNCMYKDLFIPANKSIRPKNCQRRLISDQQPEEAASVIEMLLSLYKITGKDQYKKLAFKVFGWFLGKNTLKQFVYDHHTGGCFDGLSKKEVNLNQGAESTISYLISRILIDEL